MTGSVQDKSNRERVWAAIMELHNQGQIVTRQRVQELSKLSFHVVDGHITSLIERDGKLRRVMNGVFEPVVAFVETRSVSVTDTPEGMTKVEIGDEVIQLTPTETRMLAKRLQGDAQTAANVQMQQDIGNLTHEVQQRMAKQIQDQTAQIEKLTAEVNRPSDQQERMAKQSQEQAAQIKKLKTEVRRLSKLKGSPQKELLLT